MKKKAYIQDFLFFAIVFLILAIIFVIGGKLIGDLNTEAQDTLQSTTGKNIVSNFADRYSTVFDFIFLGVFIMFALAIIVSFFMLDTHPVLFFAVIIVFAFILVAVAVISNAYEEFSNNDSVSTQAAEMTMLSWLMSHYIIFIVGFGFLGVIALFAKLKYGY